MPYIQSIRPRGLPKVIINIKGGQQDKQSSLKMKDHLLMRLLYVRDYTNILTFVGTLNFQADLFNQRSFQLQQGGYLNRLFSVTSLSWPASNWTISIFSTKAIQLPNSLFQRANKHSTIIPSITYGFLGFIIYPSDFTPWMPPRHSSP